MPNIFEPRLQLGGAGIRAHRATVTFSVIYESFERRSPGTHYDVEILLRGKDVSRDDNLGLEARSFHSNGEMRQSLEFSFCVADSVLNEDPGTDEVYAEIKINTPSFGGVGDRATTNVVTGRF